MSASHEHPHGGLSASPSIEPMDRAQSMAVEVVQHEVTIPVLAESMEISKRQVLRGVVRVSTRTETYEDVAEVSLDRNVVDVTRVAIGKIVDVAPSVRIVEDTTIIPVIEERLVVVKQLYLKEELHIRNRVEHTTTGVTVPLRRQTATIERLDADGRSTADLSVSSPS